MTNHEDAFERTEKIINYFHQLLVMAKEEGDIGFASFNTVFDKLMPIQQNKLKTIVGNQFETLMNKGSIVCIGVSYRGPIMDCINYVTEDGVDYQLWNNYASEYNRLNQMLNQMSKDIATHFGGIPLDATIGGIIDKINHVSDYFGMVLSHRIVAENSGLGWRGKNQLIIHDRFSCAIRFASIIVPYPLKYGEKGESQCGSCTACEDVCSFIRNREKLPDYRENCRRYILHLKLQGIERDICGKCIKACYLSSIFKDVFELPL
ncbi:MAG: 4Fe-4S dicluster domain-containing protein [Candidatus Thorarchaeota archaeon SMTZ1-45]|nr:MAG: hypothetical protein AM325_08180 [Candidatus Thorarchaeota archaeon SMTZ1-45]